MKMTEFSSQLLRERYVRIEHPSGLPIYVFPKKMTTSFAYFAVRYGSRDCEFYRAGESEAVCVPDGVAHFLEHKLFENEDGSDAFAHFAELGADSNAFTSYDRTAYLFSCTERFPEVLEQLLDFVTHPHFTAQSVKREQGIIAEEIRMYEDNPWERCYQNLLKALYQCDPVRKNICGSIASIKKITPELLYDCYRRFYTAENMALVVCGDVDPETVAEIAERVLPPEFSQGKAPERRKIEEPEMVAAARVEIELPVSKPIYAIGVKEIELPKTPEERLHRHFVRAMLDEILFSRSGSFYNDLFERGILTPSFSTGSTSGDGFAFFTIEGEADDPERVFTELTAYLERVRAEGVSDEDFERARRVLYADEICSYDSTEEIAGKLLPFAFSGTDPFTVPDLLQSITKHEVETLLCEMFREGRFAMSVVRPLSETDQGSEG